METLKIHRAMERILDLHLKGEVKLVKWEDATGRKWFGDKGQEAKQGAGSIKRDCSILRDFFKDHGIPNLPVPPQAGHTKWDRKRFEKVTGWTKRTSEHARDAAILIIGGKA